MKMLRMTVTKMRAVAALLSMFRRGCFAMSFRFKRAVQHNAKREGGLQTGSKCPSSWRPPLPGKCSWCPSVLGSQSRGSSHRNATGATACSGMTQKDGAEKNSSCFVFFGKVLCFAMEVPWPCYGSALKRQVTAAHQADTCHGPPNTAWPWDMVRAAVGHGRQRQQCSGCSGRSVISPFLTPRCDLCGAPLSALEQEWVSPG